MIIGAVRETFDGERRVALVPAAVAALCKKGFSVLVERGAGAAAGYPDAAYEAKGAKLAASRDEVLAAAEVVVMVRAAGADPAALERDAPRLRSGQVIIAAMDPLGSPGAIARLAATGVTGFALELIPRISRAQSMDILSSMATIAGYKAVLLAAAELPRMFPLMMTAAGTLAAARVFVVGVGVAGLQAIATARRLGAVVQAYDVRPAVREQVESLGARFVDLGLDTAASEDKGGYAKALGEEFYQRQREVMAKVVAESDAVITTALIPGRPSPVLVTADMVAGMAAGSVIVDLAAERGGNCELTQAGKTVDSPGGVRILGPLNLPATVPFHASQMLSGNAASYLSNLFKEGPGGAPAMDDEIVRETLVAQGGRVASARIAELIAQEEKGGA